MQEEQHRQVGMTHRLAKRIQVFGWALFIVSAIGFIASSVRSRDVFGFVGSVVFLVACFVFLIPLIWQDTTD